MHYLATIIPLEKVLDYKLFCILIYQMMGALFKKMINPVWPLHVTLLAAWEASTYTVVLTGSDLVSGHIFEGGNCSSASWY